MLIHQVISKSYNVAFFWTTDSSVANIVVVYQRKEHMVGREFTEFVSPKDQEKMIRRGQAREGGGKDVISMYEFKARRKDGTEFGADISVNRYLSKL